MPQEQRAERRARARALERRTERQRPTPPASQTDPKTEYFTAITGSSKDTRKYTNQIEITIQPLNTCYACSQSFSSRNDLFAHLKKTDHFLDSNKALNEDEGSDDEDEEFHTAITSIKKGAGRQGSAAQARPKTFAAPTAPKTSDDPSSNSARAKTWGAPSATAKDASSDWGALVEYCKLEGVAGDEEVHHRIPGRRKGTVVNQVWVKKERLGTGGYGEVSRQENKKTGEMRAVKRMLKSSDIPSLQLHYREIKALSMLQEHNDNFVKFFGWYEDINFTYIAMEYAQLGDLGSYIKNGVAKEEATRVTRQILEALVILHDHDLCHRDIKPQNVLVIEEKPLKVKLTDFGGSKNAVGTQLRTNISTRGYTPPEMHFTMNEDGIQKPYTNKVDMWSLGCMVHEILTMEVPFVKGSRNPVPSGFISAPSEAIFRKFLDGNSFPMDHLEKHMVEKSAISFVTRLLSLDPAKRPTAKAALKHSWTRG